MGMATKMKTVAKERDNIRDLAEIFIKEHSSLEILFMLTDEGPKTVEELW